MPLECVVANRELRPSIGSVLEATGGVVGPVRKIVPNASGEPRYWVACRRCGHMRLVYPCEIRRILPTEPRPPLAVAG